jgi:hypothetical protein
MFHCLLPLSSSPDAAPGYSNRVFIFDQLVVLVGLLTDVEADAEACLLWDA